MARQIINTYQYLCKILICLYHCQIQHLNPTNWLGEENINDGFEWRGGKNAYTQGILIYDEVFFIEKDNKKVSANSIKKRYCTIICI